MTDVTGRSAIVILGAAVWAGGKPSPTLARRIATGAELARKHPDAPIVASGGLGDHPPSEAAVMLRELRAHGIAADRVLLEDRSTSTLENARHSIDLLTETQVDSVIVVTDRYHLPRALMTFRLLGMPARGHPAPGSGDTPVTRIAASWLREGVAYPVYALRLWRLRAGGGRR